MAERYHLAAFLRNFRAVAVSPFAAWLSTDGADLGLPDPWPELVARMEAEGAELIGSELCSVGHDKFSIREGVAPCPRCGAAV